MSVGCVQLRDGVVWNADDARAAEAEIEWLRARLALAERVVEAAERARPLAEAAVDEAAGWSSRDQYEGRVAVDALNAALAAWKGEP